MITTCHTQYSGHNLFIDEDLHQAGFPTIKPGDSRHWDCDVAEFFQPLKPGKYFLTLETTFGGAKFIAEKIPFTVR